GGGTTGGGGTTSLTVTPAVVDLKVTSTVAVGAYQTSLKFNPAIVQLTDGSVTGGDAPFNATPLAINIDNVAGTVTISDFKLTAAPAGTITVAHLRFTAKAAGTSALTLSQSAVT